jgi:hypothetical protein
VTSGGGPEGWISGFVRDELGRLVVVGPNGEAVGGGGSGVTPESKGAKGDLKYVADAGITNTSKTLTSATAAFTAADVGKTINIRGAGLAENKGMLTTTIAAVTNATTIELAAASSATGTNKVAIYGTDDTEAIRSAVNSAVEAGLANGSHFAEVSLKGRYMVAGAPIKGGTNRGNAQIPIPFITPTSQTKFRLVFNCPGRGAPLLHWNQTAPQIAGATIFSPLINAAADGEFSVPSVIGGPTNLPNDPLGGTGFSNMSFELVGALTILMPRHANHMAMDLGLIGQADLDALAVIANGSAVELAEDAAAKSYASNGEGLRMPKINNNDASYIRSLSVEGITYALGFADHFTCDRLATIYCSRGGFIFTSGAATHGALIGNWSCEGGTTVLECESSAGARFPITIQRLDVEDGPGKGTDFVDSNSALRGTVQFGTDNEHRAPTKSGAEHLKITDNQNTE